MATSSISVPFIQWIASSLLKTYGLDRYKMPFKHHTRNTVMQVNTEKDNRKRKRILSKTPCHQPPKNYYKFEQLHKRIHPVSTAWTSFSFLNYGWDLKETLPESCQTFEVTAFWTSALVNLVWWLFECNHSFTDKPMVITEPAVPSS